MARRVLTFALVCASVVSCLSDLPPAVTCPAAPRRPVGNCVATLASTNPVPGCLPQAHECLLGPRTTCDCEATPECPESPSTCNPPPDCPAAVLKAVPIATCPKPGVAKLANCACGCPACLTACDGYGPSIAILLPPSGEPSPLLVVPLDGVLPPSGKLGFYIRLRGAARMGAGIYRGGTTVGDQGVVFNNFQQGDTPFQEVVVGPEKVAWSSPAEAPTAIVLAAAPGAAPDPGLTYVQIDCVVPIVAP